MIIIILSLELPLPDIFSSALQWNDKSIMHPYSKPRKMPQITGSRK